MNAAFEKRLAKIEEAGWPAERLVFQLLDDEAECDRLEALYPDAFIIHRVIVSPG